MKRFRIYFAYFVHLFSEVMIDVSCAIIINGGKMLAVQKGPESSHPWKWEFPGGKVHLQETAEQSIAREISEELMINIEVLQRLESIEFDYGTKPLCLIPFVCQVVDGEVILTEHVSMRWIDWTEWPNLDWAEADRQLILKNEQQIKMLLE